ncbi:MAG: hypothetical protein ACI977_000018 [Candidatus Nanohaloarchaea archaeon]|jgi:hypothetical protein
MRGLLGPAIFILTLIVIFAGLAIVMYKPAGVAVECQGDIEGFGVPGVPIGTFDSQCSAEVEVSFRNQSVCTGEARVQGAASVIPCQGLSDYTGESLQVNASFYNESGKYAEDSDAFGY